MYGGIGSTVLSRYEEQSIEARSVEAVRTSNC